MDNKFVLEIEWDDEPTGARLVGPFASREVAHEWACLNIRNGSWNTAPLARPYHMAAS